MASRLTQHIDGEGAAWAAGGFAASILIGILIEPFRGTIGLENVVMVYLLVVVLTAGVGGRTAGLLTAVSAALSYDFFLTTPYHTLVIDSLAQVITVALLLATGLAASLVGRARRRLTIDARQQTKALRLLNAIGQAVATGEGNAADQAAAEGLRDLLGARRVVVRRAAGPAGATVVADSAASDGRVDLPEAADIGVIAGTDEVGEEQDLPRLDEQGRLPRGVHLWRNGRPPRPPRGAVTGLVRDRQQVGELIVIMDQGQPLPAVDRLTLATVAHLLAAMPATFQAHRTAQLP